MTQHAKYELVLEAGDTIFIEAPRPISTWRNEIALKFLQKALETRHSTAGKLRVVDFTVL